MLDILPPALYENHQREVKIMEGKLKVEGMHCSSCEMLIKDSLEDIGVEDVIFNKNVMTFGYKDDSELEKIKETIKKEGYDVS
jgi:copper chaperone CopZ